LPRRYEGIGSGGTRTWTARAHSPTPASSNTDGPSSLFAADLDGAEQELDPTSLSGRIRDGLREVAGSRNPGTRWGIAERAT
jgi:hypothetical protein